MTATIPDILKTMLRNQASASRIGRHHRILSEAEIEALTDQEFIDYMRRRAAEYSTASAALNADFARRCQEAAYNEEWWRRVTEDGVACDFDAEEAKRDGEDWIVNSRQSGDT